MSDEEDRLVSELWRELADEESPPVGLETRLAARARSMGRARRLGWLGWSTAGFAVAGLAIYVAGDPGERPGALSEAPPAMEDAPSAPPPASVRAGPKEAEADLRLEKLAEPEAPAESRRPAPVVQRTPRRRARPSASSAAKANDEEAPQAVANDAVADSRQAEDSSKADEVLEGFASQGLGRLEGAPEAGSGPEESKAKKAPSRAPPAQAPQREAARDAPAKAPNPALMKALGELDARPLEEQRAGLMQARRLVRNEIDRAEWMWAEVGVLRREGDLALARRRLEALVDIGSAAQRFRAKRALSN